MKFTTDTKKQHTVPRFLLDHFGFGKKNKKRKLFTFDKLNETIYPQSVYDAITRRCFYDLQNHPENTSLEPILGSIESNAAPVIKKIIKEKSLADLTSAEREKIAVFVLVQKARTLNQLKIMEHFGETMVDFIKESGADPHEVDGMQGFDDDDAQKNSFITMILKYIEFAPHILNKGWILYETVESDPFYISDNPVTWHNDIDMSPRGSLGLEVKGIQVHLPLSSTLTIAFVCISIFEELTQAKQKLSAMKALGLLGADTIKMEVGLARGFKLLEAYEKGTVLQSQPENVMFLNSLQVRYAEQYVFSKKNDFELASEMVSTHEDIRNGGVRMGNSFSK